MRFCSVVAAIVLAGGALSAFAQSVAPTVYKVQLELKPDAGTSSQPNMRFALLVQQSRQSVFKAVDAVQVEGTPASSTIDVGTTITCTIDEADGKLRLHGNLEISKVTGSADLGGVAQPIIGQRKLKFDTVVEPGTPTPAGKLLTAIVTRAD
jgi:hypothetical protein